MSFYRLLHQKGIRQVTRVPSQSPRCAGNSSYRMNTRVGFLPCLLLVFLSVGFSPLSAMAALSLESSFTVTETYTDNLFFRADNKKDDFGTLFGPNLLLQYQNPDVVLGVAYLGRMGVFVNNPKANQTIHNVNLVVDLPFLNTLYKGLTVNIDENMQFTPQLDAFSGSGAQDVSGVPKSGRKQHTATARGHSFSLGRWDAGNIYKPYQCLSQSSCPHGQLCMDTPREFIPRLPEPISPVFFE